MPTEDEKSPNESPSPPPPAAVPKGRSPLAAALLALVLLALPAYGIFQWFFCRIEIRQGTYAVLIAKTGRDLPSGTIIAGPGEKGIQLAPLGEGRHWRNPFFWDWTVQTIQEVPPGQVGVLTRLFGKEPPAGKVLVDGDLDTDAADPSKAERGILRKVLLQGRYRINTFAYRLDFFPAVSVKHGTVGVVTNRVGPAPKKRNQYVVEPGERGVQRATLGAGTHYVNPYEIEISPIDVTQKRLEFSVRPEEAATERDEARRQQLSDHVAIYFPSSDGFEILVRLAVTWQVDPERAAEAFVRISATGDVRRFDDEVIHKVLTPAMRGYARIEGSKFEATQYISGAQRSTFQHALLEKVKAACATKGILIHEVLVSDIDPPIEIAEPIKQREIAKEELARNRNQIKQALAEQSLATQTELVKQERARVEVETRKIQRVIAAKNAQDIGMIDQERQLVVAKTDLDAAKLQATAIAARGQAEADVIRAQNDAEAEPLRRSVEAFKTPAAFAAYKIALRLAPSVRGVFADPSSPFGRLFTDLLEPTAPAGPARKGE